MVSVGLKGRVAPGNAGIIFWTDVFLPVIGFGMLWAARREGR